MKSVALTLRLEEELYNRAKRVAQAQKRSFTAFVQAALADVLKKEEKKTLYDAFSLVGEDHDQTDVAYALDAQREVIDAHA